MALHSYGIEVVSTWESIASAALNPSCANSIRVDSPDVCVPREEISYISREYIIHDTLYIILQRHNKVYVQLLLVILYCPQYAGLQSQTTKGEIDGKIKRLS